MKVLITGGCGYLGYNVLRSLLTVEEITQITLYDNLYRRKTGFFIGQQFLNKEKIKFVNGDILDNYTLEKSLEDIDVVIHAAARASTPFADSNSHEFDQVNNWGTSLVASTAEKHEQISKVIYISSISVYGNTKGEIVDESSITVPKSFYGVSKLKGEQHIKRLNRKKATYIFRLGNIFGYNPCMRMDAVINRFMFDAQFKHKIEIHGNGEQKRGFISIDSAGSLIAQSCVSDTLEAGIYNLVEYNLSVSELAEGVKSFYPQLDIFHLDQHLEMRSITATSSHQIDFESGKISFKDHLQVLKNHFSF